MFISIRIKKGDTPKTLAQQFYKTETVEYLEAVEWDRDHPEHAESKQFNNRKLRGYILIIYKFLQLKTLHFRPMLRDTMAISITLNYWSNRV